MEINEQVGMTPEIIQKVRVITFIALFFWGFFILHGLNF